MPVGGSARARLLQLKLQRPGTIPLYIVHKPPADLYAAVEEAWSNVSDPQDKEDSEDTNRSMQSKQDPRKRTVLARITAIMDERLDRDRAKLDLAYSSMDTDRAWLFISRIIETSMLEGIEMPKEDAKNYTRHGFPRFSKTMSMTTRFEDKVITAMVEGSIAYKLKKQSLRCRQIADRLRRVCHGPKPRDEES